MADGGGFGLSRELKLLACVVVLGSLMSILDTTIVNVALDRLAREFGAPISTIQWVSTGYLLALAAGIPLTGWAAERWGTKRVWMTTIVLFLAGSVLAGLSWSIGSLIVFRVLQGLGGGMIMPVGQMILAQAAGPQRMGRVMSIVGVPTLLGPVLGPVIGGAIVTSLNWRWIFFVNVPMGAAALLAAHRILPSARVTRREPLDLRGLALLSPGLALLVFGLSALGTSGGADTRVVVGLASGTALCLAFFLHARRLGPNALLDVSLLRDRSFGPASMTAFVVSASIFGVMLLLPLYYQIVRGQDALVAGLMMAPQGFGAAIAMPIAGRLTDRYGARAVVPFGMVMALVGTGVYTQVSDDTSYTLLGFGLFLRGIGIGATIMPAIAAAYYDVRRESIPRATTSLSIIQRVGGSFGTAVLAVVLERRIRAETGGGLSGYVGGLPRGVDAAPIAHAFAQTFWVAVGMTALGLIPAFMLPRRRRDPASTPVGAPAD